MKETRNRRSAHQGQGSGRRHAVAWLMAAALVVVVPVALGCGANTPTGVDPCEQSLRQDPERPDGPFQDDSCPPASRGAEGG